MQVADFGLTALGSQIEQVNSQPIVWSSPILDRLAPRECRGEPPHEANLPGSSKEWTIESCPTDRIEPNAPGHSQGQSGSPVPDNDNP